MARPRKLTLEFYIHDANASSDQKIFALRQKYGNDGWATYFNLLEFLCSEDGMRLDASEGWQQETLAARLHLRDSTHLLQIIEYCVTLNLFDKQMWQSERIIFSNGLYKRYMKRLEDRQQSAERMKRKREAESLKERIEHFSLSNKGVVTANNMVVTANSPTDTDPYSDPNSDSDNPPFTPLRKLIEENTEENKLNLVFEENRIDQGLSTPLTDKPETHDKTNSTQEDQTSVALPLQNLNKNCESFATPSTSTKAIPAYEARFYRKGKRFPWKTGDGINDYDEGFVEYLNKWQQGMSKDKSKTDCYADVIAYLHNHESPNYNPNPDKNGIGEGLGKVFAHWEQYQRSLKAKTQSRTTTPSLNDADIASLRKKEIFTPPLVLKKKTRNA